MLRTITATLLGFTIAAASASVLYEGNASGEIGDRINGEAEGSFVSLMLAQVSTLYGRQEARPIAIEIKPGSVKKIVRIKSERVFPIALLGAEDLDVTAINPRTIRVTAASEKLVGRADTRTCKREDINADNNQDLICNVKIVAFRVEAGETVLKLVAETYAREPLKSEAVIEIDTN